MQVLKVAKGGRPDVNLPPFEPLLIPKIDIIQDKNSNIPIELYFRDCSLFGISNAIVNKTV